MLKPNTIYQSKCYWLWGAGVLLYLCVFWSVNWVWSADRDQIFKDIDLYEKKQDQLTQIKPAKFREFFGYSGQVDLILYPDGTQTYRVIVNNEDLKQTKVFYKNLKTEYAENVDWQTYNVNVSSTFGL